MKRKPCAIILEAAAIAWAVPGAALAQAPEPGDAEARCTALARLDLPDTTVASAIGSPRAAIAAAASRRSSVSLTPRCYRPSPLRTIRA